MNIAEIYAEIEDEQFRRVEEILFFQNQSELIVDTGKQDQFRRVLVLLLYAHFEGFCKFSLILYVNNVNAANIRCSEANYAIAAASLSDLFRALRNPEKKCPEFKRELPNDAELHRFARDREFIEGASEFEQRLVKIPDSIVDTESNLKPVVLRKNLYRLGFPHDQFKNIEGQINRLLNYRNNIAHGQSQSGISSKDYLELRDAAFEIMNVVKRLILDALQEQHYLRQS